MSASGIALRQIGYEEKSYWRNPIATFFTFAFPPMFLVIFGTLNKDAQAGSLGRISFNQYFVPSIIAFGVMSACYVNLAITVSVRRELGILKRLRGTPLPPAAFFVGVIGNVIGLSALLVAITMGLGRLLYDVPFPPASHWPAYALTLVVGAGAFCALGLACTALVPNADAAPAVVNGLFFPLVFISGAFFPVSNSSILGQIAVFFPVRHFVTATFHVYQPHHTAMPDWGSLAVIAAWGAAAVILGLRTFRWNPSRR